MIIKHKPAKTFDKIAMDIVGPFNTTKSSIQDQLFKFIILSCLKYQTAESVLNAFIKNFIFIFGSPKIVLTDRGAISQVNL